jgi:hypothetical protein
MGKPKQQKPSVIELLELKAQLRRDFPGLSNWEAKNRAEQIVNKFLRKGIK